MLIFAPNFYVGGGVFGLDLLDLLLEFFSKPLAPLCQPPDAADEVLLIAFASV